MPDKLPMFSKNGVETGRRIFLKLSPLALAAGMGSIEWTAFAETSSSESRQALINIRDFGAPGDGKTVNSPAINRAIEAVFAAGGVTLVFPAGTYMCFTIRLRSDMTL